MMKTEKPRTFGNSNQKAGKFTNYTLQENVAWSSLLEKLRNRTHLSFQNRKRKEHSNTKPLLLFIKSEKPQIMLSYLKKTLQISEQTKIQFTQQQNRNAPPCLPPVCSHFQTRARWIDVFSFNFGHVFWFVMWQRHIFGPWYTTDPRNRDFLRFLK